MLKLVNKVQISVVIPVFNEEKNIPILYRGLKPVLTNISPDNEIVFVDDGSTDKSSISVKTLRTKDKSVKLITLTRNFGHMKAVSAGLINTSGKKVVIMDADLQDPPEVITQMYHKAQEGFAIVYGVKVKRKERFIKRFFFSVFYRLFNLISPLKMPLDAGIYSLLDRKVVDVLNSLSERNKYFSGLRTWTGFSQVGVIYERAKRHTGKSKSFTRLLGLALDGLLSFSYLPLRIASFLGFILATLSFLFIILVIIWRLFIDPNVTFGWASTLSTILFIGGVQLITLGIIGEYLGRIYEEVKGRPEYLISEKIGFTDKKIH